MGIHFYVSSKLTFLCSSNYLRSQLGHLEKFRAKCPEKKLYDLSANVDQRKRVELKDRTGIKLNGRDIKLNVLKNAFVNISYHLMILYIICQRKRDDENNSCPYIRILYISIVAGDFHA